MMYCHIYQEGAQTSGVELRRVFSYLYDDPRVAVEQAIEDGRITEKGDYLVVRSDSDYTPPHIFRFRVYAGLRVI